MKIGDLVTWAGWLGIIIDRAQVCSQSENPLGRWRRTIMAAASDVEVVNESR